MADSKKLNVADSVRIMASPIIENLGLRLWDVKFVKEGADWILRIIIDKDGGVCIDDCVAVNDALDAPLDELNPIDRAYRLQVQSPGAERELSREEHFMQFIGADVKLRLHKAFNERREYCGVLTDYSDGKITVKINEDMQLEVTRDELSWIRLDDFKDFE